VWHAAKRLGLDHGEVLVPAYHHGVEVEALLDAGVRPRFYGVRRDFQLDLDSLAERMTPQTRAVYVIHYAGFPQPMDDVMTFARAHRLAVVEDCALALYSSDGWRPLGSRGDAAIFCFHKTLPVPQGGALWMPKQWAEPDLVGIGLATAGHQIASAGLRAMEVAGLRGVPGLRRSAIELTRLARRVRRLPVDLHPVGHRHFIPGQQSLALSDYASWIARRVDAATVIGRRRENFQRLMKRLARVSPPVVKELPSGVCPLFYPLWCHDKRKVQAFLETKGIESIDFWGVGSRLVRPGEFPDVDALRTHVLELPIHQDLNEEDIDAIAAATERAFAGGS
jgi:dTDP-4-amino-4,6-dideoxygalactose transaminase